MHCTCFRMFELNCILLNNSQLDTKWSEFETKIEKPLNNKLPKVFGGKL